MEQTLKMPIVKGYIKKDRLYVLCCPFCKVSHDHNNSYKIGDKTTRVPHCDILSYVDTNIKFHEHNYLIDIVGELTEKEQRIFKKNSKLFDRIEYIDIPYSKIGVN